MQRFFKIIVDLPTWYLLKVMPTFLAKAHNKSAVWPQAAFISAHSTGTCGNRPGISNTKQLMYGKWVRIWYQFCYVIYLMVGQNFCSKSTHSMEIIAFCKQRLVIEIWPKSFGPLLKKPHNRNDATINTVSLDTLYVQKFKWRLLGNLNLA